MNQTHFNELWELNANWGKGWYFSSIENKDDCQLFLSQIPGEFSNFIYPTADSAEEFNLQQAVELLKTQGHLPAIFLSEKHQQNGFVERLVRNGFFVASRDTWMLFDTSKVIDETDEDIKTLTLDQLETWREIEGAVFADFPGNDHFTDKCEATLQPNFNDGGPGFKSEFQALYEHGQPAAVSGMFYSVDQNFAYLHSDATLEQYRGKGYQKALIQFRTQKALKLGITRIYSSVEDGSASWSNYIKNGFNQFQKLYLLTTNKTT